MFFPKCIKFSRNKLIYIKAIIKFIIQLLLEYANFSNWLTLI